MRGGRPSRTAEFVAFTRAVSNLAPQVPGFSDPVAWQFLPARWQKRVERARARLAAGARRSPYPIWFRGMALFNQFRTANLDRAVLASGPLPQLVILGAGLDTRAWRMDSLKNTVVFEVDHPSSQAWKRERSAAISAEIPYKAKDLRFVAMDFERDQLAPRLREAGFDPRQPAFWLWEGVIMYLRPADVSATFSAISALSAPGSQVALTYIRKKHGHRPRALFLWLMGEPLRSAFEPAEMTELARSHGWRVLSDTNAEHWLKETPGVKLSRRQVGLQWLESIWIGELEAELEYGGAPSTHGPSGMDIFPRPA